MKRFVLVLFIRRHAGIQLWRTDREHHGRLLATLAEWEIGLLATRRHGRFFAW